MISGIRTVKNLSVHLLHYVGLDGYDLYRFEKKTIIRNLFCSCCFEENVPTEFLRYMLDLLKVSTIPLKKLTVKQIPSLLLC